MILEAEVTGKFDHEEDANKLVYSPLPDPVTYRRTRRYSFDYEGAAERLQEFVRQTLVDEVSQEVRFGGGSLFPASAAILDFGFKPGALDLEKEMILSYYRGLTTPGFTLRQLTIQQRLYLFSAPGRRIDAARLVRDIVNPAIHRHSLQAA